MNYCYADLCSDAQHNEDQAKKALDDATRDLVQATANKASAYDMMWAALLICGWAKSGPCAVMVKLYSDRYNDAMEKLKSAEERYKKALEDYDSAEDATEDDCTCPNTGMPGGSGPGGAPGGRPGGAGGNTPPGVETLGILAVFEGNHVVNIKPNTLATMFLLFSEDSHRSLELLSPNGTRITPSSNNPYIYHRKINKSEYYMVINPAPGSWTMNIRPFWASEESKNYQLFAYKFENGTDATFNNLYSDHGVDDNGNGLYDHIDIAIGVNVKVPGWYIVSGTLCNYNKNETIFAFNKTYLESGNRSQTLKFYGMHYPGSYHLKNITLETVMPPKYINVSKNGADLLLGYVEDLFSDQVHQDSRLEAYTTKPYNNLDWPIDEPWSTGIIGNYSDRGIDLNGDGQYEILAVDVGVNIAKHGKYTLTGYLYDRNKSEVAWSIDTSNFGPGRRTMHLNFDGKTIQKHGVSGPYIFGNLVLWEGNWSIMASKSYACNTAAYNYSNFEGSRS